MKRNTLRQLEDEVVRIKQARRDGKFLLSLSAYAWLIQQIIKQEKRIQTLERKQKQ